MSERLRRYAFPIDASVRAGPYAGTVVEVVGPYSVTIRLANGSRLTSGTEDMELAVDQAAAPVPAAPAPPPPPAQGSLF